jgi:hypothetical protein
MGQSGPAILGLVAVGWRGGALHCRSLGTVAVSVAGQAAVGWILTVQPPFSGGEATNDTPCSTFARFGSPLFIGVPKPTLFCVYQMGFGVNGRDRAKSLREDCRDPRDLSYT